MKYNYYYYYYYHTVIARDAIRKRAIIRPDRCDNNNFMFYRSGLGLPNLVDVPSTPLPPPHPSTTLTRRSTWSAGQRLMATRRCGGARGEEKSPRAFVPPRCTSMTFIVLYT